MVELKLWSSKGEVRVLFLYSRVFDQCAHRRCLVQNLLEELWSCFVCISFLGGWRDDKWFVCPRITCPLARITRSCARIKCSLVRITCPVQESCVLVQKSRLLSTCTRVVVYSTNRRRENSEKQVVVSFQRLFLHCWFYILFSMCRYSRSIISSSFLIAYPRENCSSLSPKKWRRRRFVYGR